MTPGEREPASAAPAPGDLAAGPARPEPVGHRIALRRLQLSGVHGVLPEERRRAQPFELDLDAWCDTAAAAASDDLADAVDYAALVDAATGVVAGARSYYLLEAMADAVATAMLANDDRVRLVRVVVRKCRPPVLAVLGSAGVEVVRRRADVGGNGRSSHRAFLGIGSNLGDRWGYLRQGVTILRGGGDVVAVSPVYETEPVGGPAGQGPYLNAVVELRTGDGPRRLLDRAHEAEAAAHRTRRERFGPRTLDVDVLWVAGACVVEPDLVVPHPRLWQRRFVLVPLADLAPELVPAAVLELAGGALSRAGTLEE